MSDVKCLTIDCISPPEASVTGREAIMIYMAVYAETSLVIDGVYVRPEKGGTKGGLPSAHCSRVGGLAVPIR